MSYLYGYGAGRSSKIYRKAEEIRKISRRISDYLMPEMASLNESGLEDKYIYQTGDIIRYSNSLVAHISKAETEALQDSRMRYAALVSRITDRIYLYSESLEKVNSNGKDFLKMLQKELRKFQRLQASWRLGL
ncbi:MULTISPECIES: hypothetical protein [Christiangramia]|uniref:Uncharacterized protein n=1 Tax=Christiangramia flava JLT2011 TaxID=1229726 RepID=A0A1L7I611_9FLAO|nr:hypothetical protein [Christiangramia flava]APU69038.1 hypothetical protein GRFL_2314 [Christiangramia flava JLT2011]OSS38362.1 hypothetical protein C723_2846 [Christiangramia flava JLT2011]